MLGLQYQLDKSKNINFFKTRLIYFLSNRPTLTDGIPPHVVPEPNLIILGLHIKYKLIRIKMNFYMD